MTEPATDVTLMTTIIKCRGVDKPVVTIQAVGDSDAEFMKAHLEAVAAAKAACELDEIGAESDGS